MIYLQRLNHRSDHIHATLVSLRIKFRHLTVSCRTLCDNLPLPLLLLWPTAWHEATRPPFDPQHDKQILASKFLHLLLSLPGILEPGSLDLRLLLVFQSVVKYHLLWEITWLYLKRSATPHYHGTLLFSIRELIPIQRCHVVCLFIMYLYIVCLLSLKYYLHEESYWCCIPL